MASTTSQAVSRIETLLADYNRKLRLARATDLAKSGRYLEAEALLSPFGGKPEGATELDLLARIALRRLRVNKARSLWEAAMRADPTNLQYGKCLKKLAQWEAKVRHWAKIAGISLLAIVGVTLIGVCIHSLIHRHSKAAHPSHVDVPPKPQ